MNGLDYLRQETGTRFELKSFPHQVEIRPAKASTVVAMLWRRIIQHERNYPNMSHNYSVEKRGLAKQEILVLKSADLVLRIYLEVGLFIASGLDVVALIRCIERLISNFYNKSLFIPKY
ncbi:hypothetical protein Ciccas_008187 [Cichlidogyrus casuarinus]|uniref:Uncharacterized protein n=1 Tax=Cichlidogyrus casuarinus TaxID=1844966 RepID=A0ABD2Q0P0_9PLAT